MSQPGYPPPYGQQQWAPPPPPARNGFGITALVLAIIGCVFGLIPFTGFIALILGLLAVLFGLLGLGRVRRRLADNKILTIVGTVLGVLSTVLGIVGIVIVFGTINQLSRDMDELTSEPIGAGPLETAPVDPSVGGFEPVEAEGTPVAAFGEIVTFTSGLQVSIAAPVEHQLGEYAVVNEGADRAVKLTVTVTNGGSSPVELNPFINGPSVSHGGVAATQVFDYNSGLRDVPQTSILPGDTATYDAAFGIGVGPAEMQAEFDDGFMGEPAIFTGAY